MIVDAPSIAARLGIDAPTPGQTATITAAIQDAQADVAAYLGCAVEPFTKTVTLQPWDDVELALRDCHPYGSWTVTPNNDGTVTLTVQCGYDAANDPEMEPVRRYVRYATLQQPSVIALWRATVDTSVSRVVRSASAEGQSITYDQITPTGEVLTSRQGNNKENPSLPSLASLDRWRVAGRRASQGVGYQSDPLPRYDTYWGYGGWVRV